MHEYICPRTGMGALKAQQQNNPVYKDITIFQSWETVERLWFWFVGSIRNSMSWGDIFSSLPPSSAMQLPLPSGDDYLLMKHLAKKQNLKIINLPGEGNWLLQAVSLQAA